MAERFSKSPYDKLLCKIGEAYTGLLTLATDHDVYTKPNLESLHTTRLLIEQIGIDNDCLEPENTGFDDNRDFIISLLSNISQFLDNRLAGNKDQAAILQLMDSNIILHNNYCRNVHSVLATTALQNNIIMSAHLGFPNTQNYCRTELQTIVYNPQIDIAEIIQPGIEITYSFGSIQQLVHSKVLFHLPALRFLIQEDENMAN